MRVRPVRTVVVLAAVATSVAGCSSESSNAKPLAPLSATPTPTASVNKTATPSLSATGPTAASAAAFVRAYYAAVNKSAITGNANGLEKYLSKSCSTCRQDVLDTKDLQRSHQRLDRAPYRLIDVTPYPPTGYSTTVTAVIDRPKANVLSLQSGRAVAFIPLRARSSSSLALIFSRMRWVIVGVRDFG